jgi:hypothetical protein
MFPWHFLFLRKANAFCLQGIHHETRDSWTESWRPRRDSNPCYRRERAVS